MHHGLYDLGVRTIPSDNQFISRATLVLEASFKLLSSLLPLTFQPLLPIQILKILLL